MKKAEFWKEIERRTVENRRLVGGGLPVFLTPFVVRGGLHFWPVAAVLSFGITLLLWGAGKGFLVGAGLWLLGL